MVTKNNKHTSAAWLVCCCITAALALTSCDNFADYDDNYTALDQQANSGAPVITAVYDVADTEQQQALTEASRGQTLVIVGQNLNNLRSLRFNTVEADLETTYTMLTRAVVTVPTAFSKEHANTIEYTTDMGTTTYQFVVALPEAVVDGLLNEFMTAGSTGAIAGSNFDYYDFTATLNGQPLSLTAKSDTLLHFRIPEGTADNSIIRLNWLTAAGQTASYSMPFRPTDDLLFADITQANQQQTDRAVTIETSDMGMPCLHFYGLITEWSWVELSFAQPLAEGGVEVSDYHFVFEVLTANGKPLLPRGYEFAWNWDWNNSYQWAPGNGSGLDTHGQWQTVRLPLSAIAPNGIGQTGETMTLNVGFQPYEDYDADFRFANFRIVKK